MWIILLPWTLLFVLNSLKEKKDVKYLNPFSLYLFLSLFTYLAVIHAIMSGQFQLLLRHWSCIYANVISIKDKTGVRMSEFKSLLSSLRTMDLGQSNQPLSFLFAFFFFFMCKMREILKCLLHYGYRIHELIHVKPLHNACHMPTIH